MIGQMMFNIVYGFVKIMLSFLPDIEWTVNENALGTFMEYVRLACYLLPMDTITTIVSLIFTIIIIRIVISFIKTIWELLPLV